MPLDKLSNSVSFVVIVVIVVIVISLLVVLVLVIGEISAPVGGGNTGRAGSCLCDGFETVVVLFVLAADRVDERGDHVEVVVHGLYDGIVTLKVSVAVLPKLVETLADDVGIAAGVARAKVGERRVELSGGISGIGRVQLGSCKERLCASVELRIRIESGEEGSAGGRDVGRDGRDVGGGGLGSNRCYRGTDEEKRSCQGASCSREVDRLHEGRWGDE